MKLLFIAPQTNLSSSAEFMRIASGHTVEIADGMLDRAGLERALRTPADVVHFVGHGEKGILGLFLDNVDAVDLVSMLGAQCRCKLFFINACDSLSLGTAIHNSLHIPVIAHDAPIDDKAAVEFAAVFYRRYRTTQNVRESFDAAQESLMRRYPTQAVIPTIINGDMATSAELDEFIGFVRSEIVGMNTKLDAIEASVDGLRSHQSQTLLVLLSLLLLAQLATPVLNGLLAR